MSNTVRETDFVNNSFNNEIMDNVIKKVYPNLNIAHQTLLHENLADIMNIIAIKFNFVYDKKNLYYGQFRQNNYKDSIALLNIILPFIDDTQDKTDIQSLNDIYTKKHSSADINCSSPNYIFSNIQYGRCNRDNKFLSEIQFNSNHIKHNTTLLKGTIQSIANKLFVNWIDILPNPYISSINKLRPSKVMKETEVALGTGKLKEWDIGDDSDELGRNYSGLPVSDIYNVIVNGLYEDVKNSKWLIYDAYIDSSTPLPFFFIIQKILPLDTALTFTSWVKLNDSKRLEFNQQWNKLVLGIDDVSSIADLPANTYIKIMKAIIFFYNKYSKNTNDAIKKGYIKFNIPNNDDIDEDNEALTGIDFNDMKKSVKSLQGEFLYDFIVDQFSILHNTYYGHLLKRSNGQMDTYNNIKDDKTSVLVSFSNGNILTFKNYYNFAKSLSHYTNESTSKYVYYGNLWNGLIEKERKEVIARLNMNGSDSDKLMEWFNISNYLTTLHVTMNGSIEEQHQTIFKEIKNYMALVLENIMAFKGIYSHFLPSPEISNEAFHPGLGKDSTQSEIYIRETVSKLNFEGSINQKNLQHSHYFLTNTNYPSLGPYKVNHNGKNYEMDYYEYMTSPKTRQAWYTTYAMNWVSQISFFHRYINNRIFYVTGSTGVGKSTQIPKLLLYALKAIDFNDKGKIVCTQPRIPPTKGNAIRIASELGLPIQQYDSRFKKEIKKENYTVQYKYQGGSHISNNNNLSLKIVTDGTLYLELKNPFLKKRVHNKVTDKYTYNDKNVYDIVIVDEAHEHNANMDMILTLMRNTLYYNNSIKLIIISATMADDEPIYRRFYRNINDNQMYPFDYTLQKYNLDRINVDRRVHISPPGQTTRFTITEHYVPNEDPLDVIMQIVNTSNLGDMLLFQSGEADISNSVQELNKLLPEDVIALPYFSSMHTDKKTEIENIHYLKNNIIVSHDADYKYFITVDDGNNKNKVNKNTYKRVVIVATNIAEASITIPSLKYVIDTGKQKIGLYDPITHQSSLVEIPISESSRLQRKGRVGRTSSGDVYYMYKKDSMINNKTAYNISVQDITDTLFSSMRSTYTDNKILFDINTIKELKDVSDDIKVFITKQYFKNDSKISFVGNNDHYDYHNNVSPPSVYSSGYDTETLTDPSGIFYIIHPEELSLNRNINGKITSLNKSNNITISQGNIVSFKMSGFWDILEERLCVIKSKLGIIKTEYGNYLYRLKEVMKLDDIRYLIMYIFSRQYGVSDDIIKIIPLIDICINSKISLNRWASNYINNKGKFRTNLPKLKHLYGNCDGDITGMLCCINKLFDHINLFQVMPTEDKILKLQNQKEQYIKFQQNEQHEIDLDTYQQFRDLDLNNKLTYTHDITETEKTELIKNDIDSTLLKLDLESKEDELQNWCNINYIDYQTLVTYLKSYIRFRTQLYKKNTNSYDTDPDEKNLDVNFSWFDEVLYKFQNIATNKQAGINMSLLHSFGSNICKNIDESNMYINIQNPSPEFVYTIKTINPFISTYDTLLNDNCQGEYILYFSIDNNTDSVYMIQNISVDSIQKSTLYLYTPIKIQHLKNIDYYNKMISLVLSSIDTDNKTNIIKRYLRTIDTIYTDLINNFDSDVWRKLEPLSQSNCQLQKLYIKSIKEKKATNILTQRGGYMSIPPYTYNSLVKFSLQ